MANMSKYCTFVPAEPGPNDALQTCIIKFERSLEKFVSTTTMSRADLDKELNKHCADSGHPFGKSDTLKRKFIRQFRSYPDSIRSEDYTGCRFCGAADDGVVGDRVEMCLGSI